MGLRPNAEPVPSLSTLANILFSKRVSSQNPDVDGGYAWDANGGAQASIENLTTAEIEHFFVVNDNTSALGTPALFARRSRSVVKDPNDPFYANSGYPNPPMGGIFRGINQDGTLGIGNYLEITPAYFIIKNALSVSDVDLARKVVQFIDWMTFDTNFFGTQIKLVAGVARLENGSWQKKTDTVLIRNMAWAVAAYYELFSSTYEEDFRTKGRNLLKSVVQILNTNRNRVNLGEIPPFMAWAIPHAYVSYQNGHTVTWNRWTIEHLSGVVTAIEKAMSVEGRTYQIQDWQGNQVTLEQVAAGLGSWVDTFFEYPLIMRDHNANAPYLPYQFIFNQAWYPSPKYFVGVNLDWTEESGSVYSQSGWWVGDLELWGIWGMLKLKRMGFTQSPVERFLWDWLRLPPGGYLWHDRYNFFGDTLDHDLSVSTAFTALYGLCLKEGYNPQPPPPRVAYSVQGGGVMIITTDKKSVVPVVRNPNGQVIAHTQIAPASTTRGYTYRYDLPSNLYFVTVDETFSTDFMESASP